jgi:hypothetical protein
VRPIPSKHNHVLHGHGPYRGTAATSITRLSLGQAERSSRPSRHTRCSVSSKPAEIFRAVASPARPAIATLGRAVASVATAFLVTSTLASELCSSLRLEQQRPGPARRPPLMDEIALWAAPTPPRGRYCCADGARSAPAVTEWDRSSTFSPRWHGPRRLTGQPPSIERPTLPPGPRVGDRRLYEAHTTRARSPRMTSCSSTTSATARRRSSASASPELRGSPRPAASSRWAWLPRSDRRRLAGSMELG